MVRIRFVLLRWYAYMFCIVTWYAYMFCIVTWYAYMFCIVTWYAYMFCIVTVVRVHVLYCYSGTRICVVFRQWYARKKIEKHWRFFSFWDCPEWLWAYPVSYSMGTRFFPRTDAVGAWSWPLTSIYGRYEWVELYLCTPYILMTWTGQLYLFHLHYLIPRPSKFTVTCSF
jgi:hypothetical protein